MPEAEQDGRAFVAIFAEGREGTRREYVLRPAVEPATAAPDIARLDPVGPISPSMVDHVKDLTGRNAAGMMVIAGILVADALCTLTVPTKTVNR